MLERAWDATPHPDLLRVYRAARPGNDAMARLTDIGKLVQGAPDHAESQLALAEAALDAELWGEARRHLGEAAEQGLTEKVCRLMARLEDSEHQDRDKARAWLLNAAGALPDPAWVCGNCGAAAEDWSARCGACREFDSLAWQAPPRVAAVLTADPGAGTPPAGSDGASGEPETTAPAPPDRPRERPPAP
jgi:HemY protein